VLGVEGRVQGDVVVPCVFPLFELSRLDGHGCGDTCNDDLGLEVGLLEPLHRLGELGSVSL
jgi:hypothetical protein